MSAKQSRKGVSVWSTWNLIRLIGELTYIEPKEAATPIPNLIVTLPFEAVVIGVF